ncbi:MAG: c-type cytochrome [Verrucomicrobia bacterium]|nr:c-type cytochrome [Verrucomicrobiota bacterium]
MAPIIRDTTLTVREGIASSNQLVESMELLGKLRVPQLVELVNVVLDRDSSSELVVQSLRVCQELKDPSLLALAEERFHRFLPAARRQFLSLYFETSIRLERILDWIDAGQLAVRELSDRQKSLLLKHKDSRIRERAGLLLARKRVDGEEAMSSLLPALLTDANIEKGKHYFVERCILCHQIGTLGVAVGPAVASMRGLRKRGILEAVLFPNREVAPQYFGITVAHDSGTETGILRGESDRSITIRQAGGTDLTLVKSSITSIRSEGVSLMPEGLLEGLEVQEVADLLEFIMYEGIGQ